MDKVSIQVLHDCRLTVFIFLILLAQRIIGTLLHSYSYGFVNLVRPQHLRIVEYEVNLKKGKIHRSNNRY